MSALDEALDALDEHVLQQQFGYWIESTLTAARAELTQLRADAARLRARTHEIQERADKRIAALEKETHYARFVLHEGMKELAAYRAQDGIARHSDRDHMLVGLLRAELEVATRTIEDKDATIMQQAHELRDISERLRAHFAQFTITQPPVAAGTTSPSQEHETT